MICRRYIRAVQTQLCAYLKKHNILCVEQSGFREMHSTVTATTDVTDHILRHMDQGKLTGAAFLDLKKAFDTVDSDTLLFKLDCLGIKNTEQLWFQNYLRERTQCVQFQNAISEHLSVTCGVPQGSILGPLLFIVYINDLSNVVTQCKVVLYADDTILMYSSQDLAEIKQCLEYDLNNASDWFHKNKLNLNISKCKWMLFGTQKRLRKTANIDITINGDQLEKVNAYKYLGLIMDSALSWQDHLLHAHKKIRQRIGVLRRVRQYMDQKLSLQLYHALILPMFDYCDSVYGNCNITALIRMQRLQNRAGKIILHVPFDTATSDVLSSLKWFYVTERVFYHQCILVYKCLNDLAPEYLCQQFQYPTHCHETRYSTQKNLVIPKCNLCTGQRAFSYKGAQAWNSLTDTTRKSLSLASFKTNLVKEILAKRPV